VEIIFYFNFILYVNNIRMVLNINLFNYFVYNQFGGKKNNQAKWKSFYHSGVLFPDPYKPHGIP